MRTHPEVPDFSLLAALEGPDGRLDRRRFPVLASTLDKKYASPGVHVVRWYPCEPTVELSDGRKVEKVTGSR